MQRVQQLAKGKTKIIWGTEDPGVVLIESMDDITAGDGAKRDELEGKAVVATTTTCNVFELLEQEGVDTHYLGLVDDRTFRARRVDMIPLELVVRRIATGSYLKRNPEAVEGEFFEPLVFEIFHKDDSNHDPILRVDFDHGFAVRYPAGQPAGGQPLDEISLVRDLELGNSPARVLTELEETTRKVFVIIEQAWKQHNIQLVDLKIEAGWAGEMLVVADVIDNDSWRIWPDGDRTRMLDKQVYRDLPDSDDPAAKAKELGRIKNNYARVAELTGSFVK